MEMTFHLNQEDSRPSHDECLQTRYIESHESNSDAVADESGAEQSGRRPEVLRLRDNNVTTVMIRNLPCHICPDDLAKALDESGFPDVYDFLYMPSSLSTGRRHDYAFVNFHNAGFAAEFTQAWHNTQKFGMRGRSRINVSAAITQGLDANVENWLVGKSSRIKSLKYWPLIQADRIANPRYQKLITEAFSESVADLAVPANAQSTSSDSQQEDGPWGHQPPSHSPLGSISSGSSVATAEPTTLAFSGSASSGSASSGSASISSAFSGYAAPMTEGVVLSPQHMPQDMQLVETLAFAAQTRAPNMPQDMQLAEALPFAPQTRTPKPRCPANRTYEGASVQNPNFPPPDCMQPKPSPYMGSDRVMAFVFDADESPAYIGTCRQVSGGGRSSHKTNIHIPGFQGSETAAVNARDITLLQESFVPQYQTPPCEVRGRRR